MNSDLLRQVRDSIASEPLAFDMGDWAELADDSPCGTTMCIAGHALAISGIQVIDPLNGHMPHDVGGTAKRLLGLQSSSLFHADDWPIPWRGRYRAAGDLEDPIETRSARAAITVELIDSIRAGETDPDDMAYCGYW